MPRLILQIEGVDRTANVLWDQCVFEEAASEGQIGQGVLVIRDPTGTLNPVFGQSVRLWDNGNTDAHLAYRGIIGPKYRSRDGDVDHYGVRRIHRLNIWDNNNQLDRRRVEGWSRNDESDYTRVRAVIAAFRPNTGRTTYVPNSGNVTMDDRKYVDSMVRDVVADCAAAAGKDYWIDRYNELHYAVEGSLGSNQHTWTLTDTVSSYVRDVRNATSSSAYNVGQIERFDDPNAIPFQNDLLLKFGKNKSVNVEDATSISTYGRFEGLPIYDDRAKTTANATNRANALLQRAKDPEVSYTTTIAMGNLSFISAGKYVAVTSQHQGLSGNLLRIVRFRATRKGGSSADGYWLIDLDLASPRRARRVPTGFVDPTEDLFPDPEEEPQPWTCDLPELTVWDSGQFGDIALPNSFSPATVTPAPSAPASEFASGFVIVGGIMAQNGAGAFGYPTANSGAYTSIGMFDETAIFALSTMVNAGYGTGGLLGLSWGNDSGYEVGRALAIGIPTISSAPIETGEQEGTGQTVTVSAPTAGNLLVVVRFAETSAYSDIPSGWTRVAGPVTITSSSPGNAAIDIICKCASGSEGTSINVGNNSFTHWAYYSEWELLSPPPEVVPAPGQFWNEIVGIGNLSTVLFTTTYPYEYNSLRVLVNGIEEINFTQTDPDAGTFTFDSPPFVGEFVHVEYMVTA